MGWLGLAFAAVIGVIAFDLVTGGAISRFLGGGEDDGGSPERPG